MRLRVRRVSRRWLVAAVVAVVAVAGGVTWFSTRDSSAATQTTTSTVSTGTYQTTVSASGTVAAARQADLSFEVSGTVTDVRVAAGDKVTKGQVLATVGSDTLQATLDAAESTLEAAQSQLDDDTDSDASDTQLASDRASVLSAQSSVASAQDDVDNADLRATFAGTVAAVDLEVGDEVSGGSSAGTGAGAGTGTGAAAQTSTTTASTSAVTVLSTRSFVVDATVASDDVKQVKKGLQTELTVTGLDDTVYGTVSSVGLVAETSSTGAAEFPVEIAVTGSPKGLYAGASAEGSIIVKQVTDVLTVPSQALRTSGTTTYATVVAGGEKKRRTVVTGATYGFQTEVRSGLKAGDKVEITGFTRPAGGGGTGGAGGRSGFPQGGAPPAGFPAGGFQGGAQ